MTNVSGVSNQATNKDATVKITSMKDLQAHPEFFPVWMEEVQRKNVASLLTTSQATGDTPTDQSSSVFGSDSSANDPFAALGVTGMGSSDPLTGAMGAQGMSSDFAFMTPTSSLQSYQVSETLKGLQEYSNVKEAKAWLNQVITYKDPTDSVVKTGRITRIDIENVAQPVFVVDDKVNLSLDDIKSLNADVSQTQTSIA